MDASTPNLIVVAPTDSSGSTRAGRVARLVAGGVAAVLAAAIGLGLVVGPRVLPYRVLYVRTASMAPTLPVGSLVVVTEARAEDVRRGDVLTFAHPDGGDRLVTHRVVAKEDTAEGAAFVTKGDASAQPDPWRVPARGTGWRVTWAVPAAGYALGLLQSPPLETWAFAVAVLVLAGRAVAAIWRTAPVTRPVGV